MAVKARADALERAFAELEGKRLKIRQRARVSAALERERERERRLLEALGAVSRGDESDDA